MAFMLPRGFSTHFAPWAYGGERGDELIGVLSGFRSQTDPGRLYCHCIGISPGARGQLGAERRYRRLFADALTAGCREVHAVTSPLTRGSTAFHTRLGFVTVPGAYATNGVAWHPEPDGPREDRVCFKRE